MIYLLNNFIIYSNIKIRQLLWMFEKNHTINFLTLRLSIFDFNQVVFFDISVLILFKIYLGFFRSPKVSSNDITVCSVVSIHEKVKTKIYLNNIVNKYIKQESHHRSLWNSTINLLDIRMSAIKNNILISAQ